MDDTKRLSQPAETASGDVVERVAAAMKDAVIRDDEGEFPRLFDLLVFSGENKAWTVVRGLARAALATLTPPDNDIPRQGRGNALHALERALERTGDDEAVERAWRLRNFLAEEGYILTALRQPATDRESIRGEAFREAAKLVREWNGETRVGDTFFVAEAIEALVPTGGDNAR